MASNRRKYCASVRQEEGPSQAPRVQDGGGGPRHDHRRKEEASEEVIAQKPETKLRTKIIKGLKAWDDTLHVFHPHGSQFGRNALDLVGCIQGRYFEIEVKVSGPATAAQQATIDKVLAAGGISGVAHSLSEAKELILDGLEG
jgi:hypothetical protein